MVNCGAGFPTAAFIRKGMPDQYELALNEQGNPTPRDLMFVPGMILGDPLPGEDIIDSADAR